MVRIELQPFNQQSGTEDEGIEAAEMESFTF
jgi:hypothetical protein